MSSERFRIDPSEFRLIRTASDKSDLARMNPQVYDPKAGFTIYIDFVSGMLRKALQCGVVYGVYEGNAPKIPAKMLPMLDTDVLDWLHTLFHVGAMSIDMCLMHDACRGAKRSLA